MNHPFTSKAELTDQQLADVYGGNIASIQATACAEKLKPVIKPAVGTTMAIGEEGGIFNYM